MAAEEKRPDLHHSQPVRLQELLDAMTPEERAAFEKRKAEEEQRASDARVNERTREDWLRSLTLAIEKRLAEQMQLTRDMVSALNGFRRDAGDDELTNARARVSLKEIAEHVGEIKNNSRLTEGVFGAICDMRDFTREVRDLTREVRDFMAENIQQTAHMQDLQLETFQSIKDSVLAIALMVTTKGSNGHAPEGETT